MNEIKIGSVVVADRDIPRLAAFMLRMEAVDGELCPALSDWGIVLEPATPNLGEL